VVIELYFRLNPECYFIRGVECGAIFDLIENKIYALNQKETQMVTLMEKDEPVRQDEEFLDELMRLRLGNYYRSRMYIQKLRIGSPLENPGLPPQLDRAFLGLNNSCNRNCWFCGYYGMRRSLGCLGCNKWKENGRALGVEKWKEIIDGLKDLDCKDIYITGGDLALSWKKAIDVLDYAHGKFNDIYIILHYQSISSEMVQSLENRAKIIVQSEVSKNPGFNGSFTLLVVSPDDLEHASTINGKNILKDYALRDGEPLSNGLPIV